MIYPLFYILPLPSVVSLVEVHEVHTSAPVREVQRHARLTAPPLPPSPPPRHGLPAQHSSLSGSGIPPSFLSGRLFRRQLPPPHCRSIPPSIPRGGEEEEDVNDAGLCLLPCSRHLMQEALRCGIFSSRGTTDAVNSAPGEGGREGQGARMLDSSLRRWSVFTASFQPLY